MLWRYIHLLQFQNTYLLCVFTIIMHRYILQSSLLSCQSIKFCKAGIVFFSPSPCKQMRKLRQHEEGVCQWLNLEQNLECMTYNKLRSCLQFLWLTMCGKHKISYFLTEQGRYLFFNFNFRADRPKDYSYRPVIIRWTCILVRWNRRCC